jgi:tyrosine-protein kinase Etk/Wzc
MQNQPQSDDTSQRPGQTGLQLDLFIWVNLVLRRRRVVFCCAGVSAIIAVVVVLLMAPMYTATAVFLPPAGSSTMASMALSNQLGTLAGNMGSLLSLRNPDDLYIGMLQSNAVTDEMINRFNLEKLYKSKKMSSARETLLERSEFLYDKDSMVRVSVRDKDPKLAREMANGYLDALRDLTSHLALTESAQRRLFFEKQLEQEKDALADAEVDLKLIQEKTGMIEPVRQTQVEIQSIAEIRAEIASRQVQLDSLRLGATEENPQTIRLRSEIAALQSQLRSAENSSDAAGLGNVEVPTAKVPEAALEYVRREREVKYHEALFEMLSRQYEAAKLDEARESPALQVVDYAEVPDHKSSPKRTLIVVIATVFGAFTGTFWVFLEWLFHQPPCASALKTLWQSLRARG